MKTSAEEVKEVLIVVAIAVLVVIGAMLLGLPLGELAR